MILSQKFQAHSQVYVNGKLLTLEKTWQQGNVTVKKQSSLAQNELVNMARDEMNEVGTFIYTT